MAGKAKVNTRKKKHSDVAEVEEKERRRRFVGSVILPSNRRDWLKKLEKDYIDTHLEKHDGNDYECIEAAKVYARMRTTMMQKDYDAYVKGKSFYTYKKMKFPVSSSDFIDQTRSVNEQFLNEEESSNEF